MTPEGIPRRIRELCSAQLLSVAAATLSGRATDDGQAILRAIRKISKGRRSRLPGGGTSGLLEALDASACWSMEQDYDDYLFMGHTGHSATWVPLLVGDWLDAGPDDVLCAMVIANEVGGRLGASLLFGPHNGQMWVPLHRLAAACATSRLLKLDEEQTIAAMSIALYDANDPVFHGFMGPGSKIRTAANSIVGGVMAAIAAGEGLTGAADIVEHRRGFWNRFTFFPLRGTFQGLGTSWVTDTLAIKPWPGCAYVDTTIQAVLQAVARHVSGGGRPVHPEQVQRVRVDAGMLTVGMDALSREAVRNGLLTPVVVNFSIPLTVACVLEFGGLTGRDLTTERLVERGDRIRDLANKVELVHRGGYSIELIRGLDGAIPVADWINAMPLSDLLRLRQSARQGMGVDVERAVLGRGLKAGVRRADLRWLRKVAVGPLVRKIIEPLYGHPPAGLPLDQTDFRGLRLAFPARVTIELDSGDSLQSECLYPPGTSADGTQLVVATEKWRREAAGFVSAENIDTFVEAATALQSRPGHYLELLS